MGLTGKFRVKQGFLTFYDFLGAAWSFTRASGFRVKVRGLDSSSGF